MLIFSTKYISGLSPGPMNDIVKITAKGAKITTAIIICLAKACHRAVVLASPNYTFTKALQMSMSKSDKPQL